MARSRDAMRYLSRAPAPPLDSLVESLWLLADAPAHSHERIVPAGTFELVVNLAEDQIRIYGGDPAPRRHRGVLVSGAFTRSFVADTREHASMLGVHLRPGAARAFIGVAAHELADSHVDLADLWSPAAAESLRDALCSARHASERFDIMERALRERLRPSLAQPVHLRTLLSASTVRDAAAASGKSQRSFIRGFAAEVGLTPKLFLRIRRFNRAFALARAAPGMDGAELALACGYFDQSHLIRDFKQFAGLTPAACARLAGVGVKPDHLPIA